MHKPLRARRVPPPRPRREPDELVAIDDIQFSHTLAERWLQPYNLSHSRKSHSKRSDRRLVLAAIDGCRTGLLWEFTHAFVVGCGPEVDLHLDDPSVCPCHAEFIPERDGWEITDLGSLYGVHLNGGRLTPGSWPLRRRDVVNIGQVTLLVERCD